MPTRHEQSTYTLGRLGRISSILCICLTASGCFEEKGFRTYSNYDLKQAWAECRSGNLSGAGEQRCANIRRECERRKAESGFRC